MNYTCYRATAASFFFLFFFFAATPLTLQLHQERIQMVHSTKVVRRIPIDTTESNGTPAMDRARGCSLLGLQSHCICYNPTALGDHNTLSK